MSGLEVFGLVVNIISVAETIIQVYDAIKDLHGLPEAFHEVNKRLPLVEHTLRDVKSQTKKITSAEEANALSTLLKSCQQKITELQTIFNEIAKNSKDNFVVSVYKSLLAKLGKKGRVETLMDGILKDLGILVVHHVFQTSTQKHVEELDKARKELAKVPQSLPDSEFDDNGGNATQIGGRDQHNIWGDNAKTIYGNNFDAGRDQNFAVYYIYYINLQSDRRLHDITSPDQYRKYLDNLDKHKKSLEILPSERDWGDRKDPESARRYTTFESTFQILVSEKEDAAIHILILSAFFGMASIREPFFSTYYSTCAKRPPWLEQLGNASEWDAGKFGSVIGDLHSRGLIRQSKHDSQDIPDGTSYSIDPDMRAWIRQRPESSGEDYAVEALLLLSAFIRASTDCPIPLQIQLQVLAHLNFFLSDQTLRERIIAESAREITSKSIALCFANFFRKCSRLKDSKTLLEELLLQAQGGSSENILAIVDIQLELGATLRDNSQYGKAEKQYRAVGESAEALDPERRCRYLIGLGDSNGGQFHFREARAFAKKALVLAGDIRDRGRLLTEARILLAKLEGSLGNVKEAGDIINNAFNDATKPDSLGPEDNLTLEASIGVAGDLMMKMQTIGEAKNRIEKTLATVEARNGPDHRLTLNCIFILGDIYGRTGYFEEARNWFLLEKSRAETLFGDTPGDAKLELQIGFTYRAEQKYDLAEMQFDKALKKAQEIDDESTKRLASGNLFLFYLTQLRLLEAIPLFFDFVGTFPFAFVLRTNKIFVFLASIFLTLLLLSGLRGNLATAIIVSVVVGIIGLCL